MNKISITIGLLVFAMGYIFWHINFRLPTNMNTIDNLAITNTQDKQLPFTWLRERYVTEKGETTLMESKEACFSLHELTNIFSADKDVELLQKLCTSTVEKSVDGYKIAANCRNASATFYVDVVLMIHHSKWQEWQQTILDNNRNLLRQEKIIFKQRGECHVSN